MSRLGLTCVAALLYYVIILAMSSKIGSTLDNSVKNWAIGKANMLTPNKDVVVVIDWSLPADIHRLFIVDTNTQNTIYSWYTSHGEASGSKARAIMFSNQVGSHKTSLGQMMTAEVYYSHKFKRLSLRLDGIEKGINDNARRRAIVMHPANYVSKEYMDRNRYPGRSHGCITLNPADSDKIIHLIKEGVLILNVF